MTTQAPAPSTTWTPLIPAAFDGQLRIHLPDGFMLSEDWWEDLREAHRHVRIELTPQRELRITMVSFQGSIFTMKIGSQILAWSEAGGGGLVLESAAGYDLPTNFRKYPDGSWVSDARKPADPPPYTDTYDVIPNLMYEIRSPRQSLRQQQEKMAEWIAGGVEMGWLIDPFQQTVHIYRADGAVELQERPAELSGEDVCVGLIIDLRKVWD